MYFKDEKSLLDRWGDIHWSTEVWMFHMMFQIIIDEKIVFDRWGDIHYLPVEGHYDDQYGAMARSMALWQPL